MQSNSPNFSSGTRLCRRIAALTGRVLAGLALLVGPAFAQSGPLAPAPEYPTPYHSPLFHSGGASTPYPLTGVDPLIDPLFPQLQGTPTGYYPQPPAAGAVPTQIPSFLLGNYVPASPPTGVNATTGTGNYYPSHFADGSIYSWSAPFSYVPQGVGGFTLDDSQTTAIAAGAVGAGSVFATPTGTWDATQTTGDAAGTATGGEYLRLDFGQFGTATWTMTVTSPGSYSVYFHIPDNIADSTGNVETRNANVTYLISITGSNPQSGAATASQTEANASQFLAGPFLLQAGDVVTVTLKRTATQNNLTDTTTGLTGQYDLIADSMSLQASFGDVQSTPTAINRTAYPNEFASANLRYWGILQGTVGATAVTSGGLANILLGNAPADLTAGSVPILHYGNGLLASGSDTAETNGVSGSHLIRQLVYFGRSEPVFANQATIDDTNAAFTQGAPLGFATQVGTAAAPVATATNGEYRTANAVTAGGTPATWTLTAPNAGSYSVSVNIPTPAVTTEKRITDATYKVYVNGVQVGTLAGYPINQITQTGNVTLPVGALLLNAGDTVTVSLAFSTANSLAGGPKVVADSATITTGATKGAIYCVDGFNGAVVWRYEIPGSANGPSAPVFSSPAVARINVMITPPVYGAGGTITTPAVYANKLVVIVGDNNGLVYCLDAIGNGDGTSNTNVINQTTGQPIFANQPAYGTVVAPITPATVTAANAHVGTTGVYWIYRPDANRPKNIATGQPRVSAQGTAALAPNSDLPVPAAFGTASPTVFVDPSIATATPTASNATVYVGNSNGVLYALDAGGVGIDGASAATFAVTGDRFNVSQDLGGAAAGLVIPTCQPKWWFSLRGADPNSGANTSSADIESAPAIYVKTVTTPITVTVVQPTTPPTTTTYTTTYVPTVYVGSAHEQEITSNVGRLYALNGLFGPSGNNGKSDPEAQPNPTAGNYTGPGSASYNVGQKPQTNATDTADWTFPDALDTVTATVPTVGFKHQSSTGLPRPALGNITGSPVVFTNFHEAAANTNADGSPRQTRIYFAANVGIEIPAGSAAGTAASVRPDDTQTGRVWAVNLDGSVGTTTNKTTGVWAYPIANDPNNAALDTSPEPLSPIGAFLHATPAIGFVQFPSEIDAGNNNPTPYAPTDAFNTGGIKGQSVPMLYIGTRGVDDTALYAVDLDGEMTPGPVTPPTPPTASLDTRTIYRQLSPDGSIFQSSPVLVTNATNTTPPGGNGGIVLLTGGNTLYDFSATPISNPIATQNYPLIREDRAYTGFGPISGPAIAAYDVSDVQGYNTGVGIAATVGNPAQQNVTDWVYVGDSSTGFCRGITPNDLSDDNIAVALNNTLPIDVNGPGAVDLSSIVQTYLVADGNQGSRDARVVGNGTGSALPVGKKPNGDPADLPVYEWGQNVYIRFKNVVPPNPSATANSPGDLNLLVHDNGTDLTTASAANPITVYSNGGPIEFDLSDVDDSTDSTGNGTTARTVADHGTVPALTPTAPASSAIALPNGFYPRTDPITAQNPADPTSNLVDAAGTGYIGAYTYAISDGTARRNTPGGRRQVVNAHQTVTAFTYIGGPLTDSASFTKPTTVELVAQASNGNEVTVQTGTTAGKPTYGLKTVAPVDQPTFGILNPLGIRAGGIPLITANGAAQEIGSELGPFRPVSTSTSTGTILSTGTAAPTSATGRDLEALTNGNSVYQDHAPPSTAGLGDPTKLNPLGSANSIIPASLPYTVVTSTPLIPHNSSGTNSDLNTTATALPSGAGTAGNGLTVTTFGYPDQPYAANIFDRTPLGLQSNGNRTVSVKMGIPPNTGDGTSGSGGLYWNDNNLAQVTGHDAVVNYLPWESAPGSYRLGSANTSPDYPDISPQNIAATVHSTFGATDVQGGSATLTQAGGITVAGRTVNASALQIHVTVPHYQPANQQIYAAGIYTDPTGYSRGNEVPPLDSTGASNVTKVTNAFPMGYISTRRIYVPTRSGRYQPGAAYRDISIYTGVPVDMSTSIANPTTDIGKIPAAFGVQTENYTPLSLFAPVNPVFQDFFKPLEIHNDGNVNLLNVHLDQKYYSQNGVPGTLPLTSDALDPLSFIDGYDLPVNPSTYGVTGPRTGTFPYGTATVPEQAYLIRSSLDTDLVRPYGRNPYLSAADYPGATFHKPLPGGDAPSILTVPDSPESTSGGGYVPPSSDGLPAVGFSAAPYVSLAVPFGTPVGTYSTAPPQSLFSLRLFEGMDTAAAYGYSLDKVNKPNNYLYPPQYGKAVGGIGAPTVDGTNGEPLDSSNQPEDIYNGAQPLSTIGTQLSATVVEQRLTDGNTFGGVPMIDAGSAGTNAAGNANTVSAPDFAPAAFRDSKTGDLSVYWTSGRQGPNTYNLYAANLPFTPDPTNTAPGQGYFLPAATQWWTPFSLTAALPLGTNSGLTTAQDYNDTANVYAFAVNVSSTTPYSNTLYSYSVAPTTGALSNARAITTDSRQVKYGVKGLYSKAGFGSGIPNLWAFWTASTRGRTAISYSATTADARWSTAALLPVPAGLTSVADASPLVMPTPTGESYIEVTYSGTGPDGNVDLYTSRYLPTAATGGAATLALQSYPQVTEILGPVTGTGWFQARDTAWSRGGALNVSVVDKAGNETPLLYTTTGAITPLFTKAIFDKASGLLVLTGVKVPDATAAGNTTTNTLYVDAATGRVRFAPPLKLATTQNLQVRATFNPQARRLTSDTRADSAPVTFLDTALKANDAVAVTGAQPINVQNVEADRRWTIWRKSGVGGNTASATLYYKTQRLTAYLPAPVNVTQAVTITLNGTPYTQPYDVHNVPPVYKDDGVTLLYPPSARIYFPISSGAEGANYSVSYTDTSGAQHNGVSDTAQWQDEIRANDTAVPITSSIAGLAAVNPGYTVPIDTAINENNVAAFLDPFADVNREHKVWLFWNSTRNGTADIYSETINPLF